MSFLPSPGGPDAACARIAARQLGLISRPQALGCGLSPQAIRRRVDAGHWVVVLPGVYRLPGVLGGWQQDVMAATLWAGAFASHRCAAALRGWDGVSEWIVEITAARRLRPRPGMVIHQMDPAVPQDQDQIGPIPVTGAARTLLDLGSVIPIDDLELALEDALRRGHVSLARLRWQIRAQGGKGRRGTAPLRKLLEERPPGYRVTKSGLEIKVRRVLRAGKLPEPIYEHPVKTPTGRLLRPDFSYPHKRLAIECESYRWHGGRMAWLRDIERYTMLRRMGWTVIQVTSETLERDKEGFLNEVQAVLSR